MGRHFNDLTGRRFGWLAVVRKAAKREHDTNARWECVCKCGETTEVNAYDLLLCRTKSCGCYGREQSAQRARTLHLRRWTP